MGALRSPTSSASDKSGTAGLGYDIFVLGSRRLTRGVTEWGCRTIATDVLYLQMFLPMIASDGCHERLGGYGAGPGAQGLEPNDQTRVTSMRDRFTLL